MKDFEIVDFNPDDKKQMDAIQKIHSLVLPDSFVVMMGKVFMTQFYYKVLPKLGYLKCFLVSYQSQYVAMIVTNKRPFSLIRSSIPHYFFLICYVMSVSLLLNPMRLKVLIDLIKYKPDPLLKEFEDSGKAFEILTIGVVEEHRKLKLENGMKISHALLKHAVNDYKQQGYEKITGQILKTNKGALGFYSKYNAEFVQSSVRDFGVILDLNIENVTFDTASTKTS